MRNQMLTGYLLHHKPYQEKRALYYFFSESHGVIHGVGKKGMPLFKRIQLFANGKRSLKTFSQIQPALVDCDSAMPESDSTLVSSHHKHLQTLVPIPKLTIHQLTTINQLTTAKNPTVKNTNISGQNLYAGFYLNEILWKLLDTEDVMTLLWQAYALSVHHLHQELTDTELRLLLRHFESILFAELGHSITFSVDVLGNPIDASRHYKFIAGEGFYSDDTHTTTSNPKDIQNTHGNFYAGQHIQDIAVYKNGNSTVRLPNVPCWSRLHKQVIDHLLDYKTLQSRELWKQFIRYAQ